MKLKHDNLMFIESFDYENLFLIISKVGFPNREKQNFIQFFSSRFLPKLVIISVIRESSL